MEESWKVSDERSSTSYVIGSFLQSHGHVHLPSFLRQSTERHTNKADCPAVHEQLSRPELSVFSRLASQSPGNGVFLSGLLDQLRLVERESLRPRHFHLPATLQCSVIRNCYPLLGLVMHWRFHLLLQRPEIWWLRELHCFRYFL